MPIIKKTINNYKGIILFFIALFLSNFIWKKSITGDESNTFVVLFNTFNLTPFFNDLSRHIAKVTYLIVHFFDSSVGLKNGTIIFYPNGNAVRIIWACTGIKQMFILSVILLVAPGNWKNKLWYIPLALVVCYMINILRTTSLVIVVKNHKEFFDFIHLYVWKYLFYTIIFFIWVAWEERYKKLKIFGKK